MLSPQLREAIKHRRPMFCAFTILFVIGISAGLVFVWSIRPIPFSSTSWKESENVRSRMIDDLLENYDLGALSRAAIDDLLGVPSGRDHVRGERYIYWVGSAGIDDMWLEIEFGNGRVSSVRHVPD